MILRDVEEVVDGRFERSALDELRPGRGLGGVDG